MNIVLIGMRGSGKSTVGKQLSEGLSRKLIETDLLIEKKVSLPIKDYLNKFGWPKFREIEKAVIKEISNTDNAIIATGGGVVTNQDNMNILKNNAITIYLKSSVLTLFNRTKGDKKRPLLTRTKSRLKDVENTLLKRANLYEEYADLIVVNEIRSIDNIIKEIIKYCTTYEYNN